MKTTYNKQNKIYTDKASNQLLNGSKNKYKKLTDLGFKKLPSDDGFVMFELNPSTLNKGKQ
jgi:hypothetical protein